MLCLNQTNHLGSSKFGFISSSDLVARMENQGLKLDSVVETKIRKNKETRLGFQKHVMRFNTGIENSQGKLQLLAINSHEGTSSLTFRMGYFRIVCSNGLIVGSDIMPLIKVNHTQKGLLKLDDSIDELMEKRIVAMNSIEKMQNRILNIDEIEQLYKASAKIRLEDKFSDKIVPMFESKRYEDNKNDLFTVFNVIQENIIRTGFYALNTENNVATKVRAIRGIESNVKVNEALFNEAFKLVA